MTGAGEGLRVAHVCGTFPPYHGGTGNVCLANARGLADRGHEVHVYTGATRGLRGTREERGLTVHRLRPLFRVGNAPCLPQLAGLRGYDVVHLHYPFPFGAEWVAVAEALGDFRLVITHHQDLEMTGALGHAQRAYDATVKRWLLHRAARVVVPTLDYARHSSLAGFAEAAPERLTEVPNPIDANRFTPGEAPPGLAERYGAEGRPVALFVGGLDGPHSFKGVPVLLDAFRRVRPDARLVIVGDGELRPRYEALARDLGVAERVAFAGRVPDEELPDHYRLADVVVLPSTTKEEIFGLVLAEGMACGAPAIATDLPGVRTVVDHGETGRLVPPGDARALAEAVDAVLHAPDRGEMGRRGRKRAAARYHQERVTDALERVYREVLRAP